MNSNEANNVNTPFEIYLIMLFIWTWNWFPVQLIFYVELCVQRHKAIIRFAETKRPYCVCKLRIRKCCGRWNVHTNKGREGMNAYVCKCPVSVQKNLILFMCLRLYTVKVASWLQLHIAYKPSAKKIYLAMKK